MTDGQAMGIARQIDRLNWRIVELMDRINDEHPNGVAMHDWLIENGFGTPAAAEHVILHHLSRPDDWENVGGTVRHKAASKAVSTRRFR